MRAWRKEREIRCPLCGKIGGAFNILQTNRRGIIHFQEGTECKHYLENIKDEMERWNQMVKHSEIVLKDTETGGYTQEMHDKLLAEKPHVYSLDQLLCVIKEVHRVTDI